MAFEQYKEFTVAHWVKPGLMGNVGGNITKLKIGNIWVMEKMPP